MKLRLRGKISILLLTTLLLVGSVFTFNTLAGLNDASGAEIITYETVTVGAGDTLWNIAAENMNNIQDVREAIYVICQTNDLSDSACYEGQELLIPSNL
ncbi:MAG: LysM peptidoglycan-binding domain-containing protein [Clostridia bacterium]|nr:LysM peptidoglycan-binding domain-containing protein [Clostridia bacterium]